MSTTQTSQRTDNTDVETVDVVVVGAGFAGLYQLRYLRERGFDVTLLEAGGDMSGIWYWNCYPGARTDTPGRIYQYSDEELWKDWDYSDLYPSWQEVRDYFHYVDDKLKLRKDIRFNTRVTGAEFDQDARQWLLETEKGPLRTRYFVLCTGFGSQPFIPDIEGLDSFDGACHHTARWPQEGLSLRGKRVGVIGTGASGVQVIQEASREAAHVTVFQRTPNFALPMHQKTLTEEDKQRIKSELPDRFVRRLETFAGFDIDFIGTDAMDVSLPDRLATYEGLFAEGGFSPWLGTFQDVLFSEEANATAYAFWRDRTRARIKDPDVAEKLAPTDPPHPFGVKRPSLEQHYYEAFNQDNVTLVDLHDSPIRRVTPKGVETADGEHELDVLVLATGFDAVTGGLTSIDIRGTQGKTLAEKWGEGVRSQLGVATAGFPNMLYVYGPQSPSGFCNGPTCAETQGAMIVEFLEYLRSHSHTKFEATPEAEEEWRTHVIDSAAPSLFPKADSWYMGANVPGKPREMLMYPAGLGSYVEKWRECADAGFAGFELA